MLEIALRGSDNQVISPVESRLSQPSYILNSIRALKQEYSLENQGYYLMGSDNLQKLQTWYKWEDILKEVQLIIYPRGSEDLPQKVNYSFEFKILNSPLIPLSSSQIRGNIEANKSEAPGLDPAIYDYIKANRLYEKTDI